LQVNGQSQTARTELRANVIAPQSEFYIGQVDGIIGGDTLSNITANMFTEIEQGREITLVGENKGYRYTITPTEDVFTGDNTFAIEEQFIEKDRYHVEVSQNADRTGITVSEREIVLKVKSDGKIAAIRLSADADSATTEINIVADQVKINDINFVSNGNVAPAYVGYVESNGYTAGVSGWRISGSGDAEFGNVVVRGSLSTSNIVGNLTMQSGGVIKTAGTGARIELSSGAAGFVDIYSANNDRVVFSGTNGTGLGAILTIGGGGIQTDFVFSVTDTGATTTGALEAISTTDSSNVATGSIITAGGVGIAKNLNVGGTGNFSNVVTVSNATADTHALNRITGDGRYYPINGIQDDGAGSFTASTNLTINIGGTLYKIQAEQL
jgi:hypothetical protein